jgi:hypothetical protein
MILRLSKFFMVILLNSFFGGLAFAEEVTLSGRVKMPGGKGVAGAVISIDQAGISVRTDADGRYTMSVAAGSHTILVEAAGYEIYGETISTGDRSQLELDFVLQPRNLQFEEIVVSAEEDHMAVSVSSPTSTVEPAAQARTSSVLAAVADTPGVAPVGQGGLFQAPSIRGAGASPPSAEPVPAFPLWIHCFWSGSISRADPLLCCTVPMVRPA